MRTSKYEILLPLPESASQDYVLINGLYGAVDLIDKNEAHLLTEAKNNPSLLEKLESSRLELLTKRGHIVNSDEQESEDMSILARIHKLLYSNTGVGLVLAPTYNCNLRCFYCLEQHRLTRGTEWLERTMSKSLVDAIFAQVKDYKARNYIINNCSLYGGEPLLAENKDIIRYICGKCRENDMKISAITNGTDLDKYLDLIQEFKFTNLQITVDGPKEIHDKRRFFADRSGSFDKIMNNIALALERGIKISVRVNVGRSNIAHICELEQEFKSRGFTEKKNFSYYFRGVFDTPDAIDESKILQEIINSGHSLNNAIELEGRYSNSVKKLTGWLNKSTWPRINPTYCGTENFMNVIGPDGLIYSCWNIVAQDELAMGFVTRLHKNFCIISQ
ncbi:MAG: radical SAM protein [Synergistaceae bacterium]|nr:radical SAM protein [Synergistaceae bacterium]